MRYSVSNPPANGVGAFMPVPAIDAPDGFGLTRVEGAPGTEPTAAPAPQRTYLPSQTAAGGRNSAQDSMVAPDVMLFSRYTVYADNMGPSAHLGMTARRLNILPVPAQDPSRVAVVSMQAPPRLGGRAAIAWPRAFQRFPLIGGNA